MDRNPPTVIDRPNQPCQIEVPTWAIEYSQSFYSGNHQIIQGGYCGERQVSQQGCYGEQVYRQGYDQQYSQGGWQVRYDPNGQYTDYYVRVYPNQQGGDAYRQYYENYYRQYYNYQYQQQQQFHFQGRDCGCGCGGRRSQGGGERYYDQRYYDQGYYNQNQRYYEGGWQQNNRGQWYQIQPKYQYWQPGYDSQAIIEERYRQEQYQSYERYQQRGRPGSWQEYYSPNPQWQRMSYTMQSMMGKSIRQFDPSVPEDLGCARAISACLQRSYGLPITDSSVSGLEQSLKRNGFVAVPVEQAQPGDVLIGHRGSGKHGHAAIYVGGDQIFNNSSVQGKIVVDKIDKFYNGSFRTLVAYRRV